MTRTTSTKTDTKTSGSKTTTGTDSGAPGPSGAADDPTGRRGIWRRARPHLTKVLVAAVVAAATWAWVGRAIPGPYAPYLAAVTGLAVLAQRYLRGPLGPTTAWAMTALLVAGVFAGTDLAAPSFTGCTDTYVNGCGARSALDNAAIGLAVTCAAWLVLVPGYLLSRGTYRVGRRLAALTARSTDRSMGK